MIRPDRHEAIRTAIAYRELSVRRVVALWGRTKHHARQYLVVFDDGVTLGVERGQVEAELDWDGVGPCPSTTYRLIHERGIDGEWREVSHAE